MRTFVQLVFVKEEGPHPGSSSRNRKLHDNVFKLYFAPLDPHALNTFVLNHKTHLDKHLQELVPKNSLLVAIYEL